MTSPIDFQSIEEAGLAAKFKIAKAVSNRLQEAGISRRAAIDYTGIKHTRFVARVTGKDPFTTDELARIAALLNITLADLITYAENTETAVA